MAGINTGRWFVSGIIAGVILAVVDFVLNGMVLGAQWTDAMTKLNLPAMSGGSVVVFVIIDLIVGLAALWIYVGIRPRYGANHTTAIYAGLAAWLLTILLPSVFYLAAGLFPAGLVWTGLVVGLVAYVVATVVGAYFYQEETA
jgi:hypothetical protein